jgi:heavy metal sensor kinase
MLTSVRARLTLWYVSVFGLLLLGFSVLVYFLVSRTLYDRLDHTLSNAAQVTASEFLTELGEANGDAAAAASEALSDLQIPGIYTSILDGNNIVLSNWPEAEQQRLLQSLIRSNNGKMVSIRAVEGFGSLGARVAVMPVTTNGALYFMVVAEPVDVLAAELESIRNIFYLGYPVTLLVAGLGGLALARKSLSPVVEMSNQAQRMGATNLRERLTIRNPSDELGRLAATFNELLSRLEESFEKMRVFMADASHELRTPLSIIRGEADVALSQDRSTAEYKESLAIVQDEVRRLSGLVDDMLALARADAGQHPLQSRDLYLNDLVEDACRAMQVLAARKGVTLNVEPIGDIPFVGDEDLLRRLMLNLLDNGIKYTPPGGSVNVKLVAGPPEVQIVVSDTGVGIPAEAAPHVFERFYRVERARSREDGGSGLGLAIARWVAEAHGGEIRLASSPGRGTTFTVSLPGR